MARQLIYKGRTYSTVAELERHLGITINNLSRNLSKGLTLEQIVDAIIFKEGIICNGREYKNIDEIASAYGLSTISLSFLIYGRGMNIEDSVMHLLSKEKVEFQGQTFDSLMHLCAHYGVQRNRVYQRLRKGATLEEAITLPTRRSKPSEVLQFRGEWYNSLTELSESYGFDIVFVKKTSKRLDMPNLYAMELLINFFSRYPSDGNNIHYIPYAIVGNQWFKNYESFVTAIGLKPLQLKTFIANHNRYNGVILSIIDALTLMKKDTKPRYIEEVTGEVYTTAEITSKYPKSIQTLINNGTIRKIEVPAYPNLNFNLDTLYTPKHDFDTLVHQLKESKGVN